MKQITDSLLLCTIVIPTKAEVQNKFKKLDSGFRRNDEETEVPTFYEFIKD